MRFHDEHYVITLCTRDNQEIGFFHKKNAENTPMETPNTLLIKILARTTAHFLSFATPIPLILGDESISPIH
ncbi:MAG: hypothetical protein ACJAVK_001477, partial [Akkermansiaceae bacterium]